MKLVSAPVRVQASGAIDLAHETAQISAQGGLRKLPGVLTFLFTWFLEFKGQGPLDNMRWSLRGFPRVPLPGDAGRKSPEAIADEDDADRALKGLIEFPGKIIEE